MRLLDSLAGFGCARLLLRGFAFSICVDRVSSWCGTSPLGLYVILLLSMSSAIRSANAIDLQTQYVRSLRMDGDRGDVILDPCRGVLTDARP